MCATKEKVRTGTQEVRYSTTGNRYHRSGNTGRHRLVDCRCNHAFGRGNGRQCHFTQSILPNESIEKGELSNTTSNYHPRTKVEELLHEVHPQTAPQWCVYDNPPSQYNDTTTHNLPKNHLISTMILDKKELSPTRESNMSSKPISARKQTSICHPNNRRVQRGDHRRTTTSINEFEATLERPPRSQQRCKTKRENECCKETTFCQRSSKHISSQQQIQSPHTLYK
jgi:hypothetical protein